MEENSGDILKDGVREVTLSSWDEFHQKVCTLTSKNYVWRGQKKDWVLQSTFDREVQNKRTKDRAKMLKRHLSTEHGMSPEEYRARWDLGPDYPLVAPNYALTRRDLAKKIGLGRKPGQKRGRRKKAS